MAKMIFSFQNLQDIYPMLKAERSLGKSIAKSKSFMNGLISPIWDWAIQRWKGTIIRENGCNYYDFSVLRPILIDELRDPIIAGFKGNLEPIKIVIKDIDHSFNLKCGDLIQIGKSKNRGLLLISVARILPVTQLLGGNGFGEIPLNFISDLQCVQSVQSVQSVQNVQSNFNMDFIYDCNYWTYENHPIIGHVPYINENMQNLCHNIRIDGHLFTLSEGSDSLNHPFIYLDFDTDEYFTLSQSILHRFDIEIDHIVNSYINGNLTETPIYIKNTYDMKFRYNPRASYRKSLPIEIGKKLLSKDLIKEVPSKSLTKDKILITIRSREVKSYQ